MFFLWACTQISVNFCIDMMLVGLALPRLPLPDESRAVSCVGSQGHTVQVQRLPVLLRFAASDFAGLLAAVQPLVDCSYCCVRKDGNTFPSEPTTQLIGKWAADVVALDCLLEEFAQVPTDVMQEVQKPLTTCNKSMLLHTPCSVHAAVKALS